jgi:hypothetical protein
MTRGPVPFLAFVLLAVAASASAAEVTEPRFLGALDLGFSQPTGALPSDRFVGGTLRGRVGGAFSLEASFGAGSPVTTSARSATGGTRSVDIGSGLHATLFGRLTRNLGPRFQASLAAGPAVVNGDVFGTVTLAHGEGAIGLRLGRRAVLAFALGYESSLTTSREAFPASECIGSSPCPPHYEAGSGQWVSRGSIGWRF